VFEAFRVHADCKAQMERRVRRETKAQEEHRGSVVPKALVEAKVLQAYKEHAVLKEVKEIRAFLVFKGVVDHREQ